MIETSYNSSVLRLFSEFPKLLFLNRPPMIYDELKQCDVLFIGINPSFLDNKKSYKFIKANHSKNNSVKFDVKNIGLSEFEEIFNNLDNVEKNIQILGQIHSVFKENYSYFKKFNSISSDLKISIEHLDMFPIRETSQKIVTDIISQNTEFCEACLEIFFNTIKQIKPKAIVVENTFARDILQKQTREDLKEFFPSFCYKNFNDNEFGTPINSSGVAIYYTSMLTGQRAMDLGSYNRLLWSLNKFLVR